MKVFVDTQKCMRRWMIWPLFDAARDPQWPDVYGGYGGIMQTFDSERTIVNCKSNYKAIKLN